MTYWHVAVRKMTGGIFEDCSNGHVLHSPGHDQRGHRKRCVWIIGTVGPNLLLISSRPSRFEKVGRSQVVRISLVGSLGQDVLGGTSHGLQLDLQCRILRKKKVSLVLETSVLRKLVEARLSICLPQCRFFATQSSKWGL